MGVPRNGADNMGGNENSYGGLEWNLIGLIDGLLVRIQKCKCEIKWMGSGLPLRGTAHQVPGTMSVRLTP